MKKLLSICVCLFAGALSLSAQVKSEVLTLSDDGVYSYQKVFDMPGKSKEVIFESIKNWVVSNIKGQANTNYFDEKDKNLISTEPVFTVSYNGIVGFKMNIEVKEGKYRLSAESFMFRTGDGIPKQYGDYSGLMVLPGMKKKIMRDVDDFFSNMLTSIQGSIGAKKADW